MEGKEPVKEKTVLWRVLQYVNLQLCNPSWLCLESGGFLLYFIFEGGIYPGEHIVSNTEIGGSRLKKTSAIPREIADYIMNK